jgi:hypothetical protein
MQVHTQQPISSEKVVKSCIILNQTRTHESSSHETDTLDFCGIYMCLFSSNQNSEAVRKETLVRFLQNGNGEMFIGHISPQGRFKLAHKGNLILL